MTLLPVMTLGQVTRQAYYTWSVSLEQSPTAHSFRTYIINFKKNMLKTSSSRSYITHCFAEY